MANRVDEFATSFSGGVMFRKRYIMLVKFMKKNSVSSFRSIEQLQTEIANICIETVDFTPLEFVKHIQGSFYIDTFKLLKEYQDYVGPIE